MNTSSPPSSTTYFHPFQPLKQLPSIDLKVAVMSDDKTLPQDILTDVLSRLPVKTLCRFKCVSSSWSSLISDPNFAETHLNRSKTQSPKYFESKAIIISSSQNLYSVDFSDINPTATKLDFPTMEQHAADKWVIPIRVWSSCNGLLLVSHQVVNPNFFLLNPSTRECKKLPTPPPVLYPAGKFYVLYYGVGYDSSTDDYKVVMTSSYNTGGIEIMIVTVYSLKTNAWRRIQDAHYLLVGSSRGVFFDGCLHCLCLRSGSIVIVAFNLSDEIFREVPLPASLEILNCHVGVVGGCLCLVDRRTCNQTEVWIMEEYGVGQSWTKFTIEYLTPSLRLLCKVAEDKVLFSNNRGRHGQKLVVYDPIKETLRDMVVAGIPSEFTFGRTYVESLVSPILGGGIRSQ
ncbi:F-box/kelch-repeat protein At3g06240-like [Rhododendron vialii]|uniref:F-box/kelch-repeat protein At3g06240-like n=1 Tax=Rhododendron vialii TaxID=182163 RepID=UPI00265EE491|nr:F-box/kelch-repeat protein At3g06240-like [Rhododendron vialii]XP_058198138.1 F-box/kelch-repeat protein At3g06240-like [Rhododendron vialii]